MKVINTEAILETQRLLLEQLKVTHAVALYHLLQDKRIYEYIPTLAPASLEYLEQRYQKLETRLSPLCTEAWLNWAVYIKEHQAYAGYIEATVRATPDNLIEKCKKRLSKYDTDAQD